MKVGKATFKIGSKSYTVKVGAVAIKKKSFATTLTAGTNKKVTVTSSYGAKDKLAWSSSDKTVVKVANATTTASAKKVATNTLKPVKAGSATITVKSKTTGKKLAVKVTVKAAQTATATPEVTPTATVSGGATTAPSVEPTATATATGSATEAPTSTPDATTGSATDAPTATPDVTSGAATATPDVTSGSATATPDVTSGSATEAPTATPVATPEVVTGGTITVTGAAVSGATIVVTNASGAAVNTADRLPAGTYTIAVTRDGYIATSKEVTLKDKDALVVEIDLEKMIEVAKVEALNLKEVKVTFTKALTGEQQEEAAKKANYTIYRDGSNTTSAVGNVSIADDNKSVILLLESETFTHGKTANKVVVSKNIGMFESYTDANVASSDVTVPQVSSVEAVGNQVIKIHFSEAIQSADDNALTAIEKYEVKLKGAATATTATTAKTATLSDDMRTVTLNFGTALAVGTYEVSVVADQVKDFAGYKVPASTKEVDVVASTNVAQANGIKVNSRTQVDVTFDGPVTAVGAKLTWSADSTSKDSDTATVLSDNKTIRFTFKAADVIKAGTVSFKLTGVVDAYGYNVPEKAFENVTVNTEAAATATVKVKDDDTLQVTFSKAMQNGTASNSTTAGDASNKAHYTITDEKGESVDLTSVTATYSEKTSNGETTYMVELNKADWNLKGNYTVTVADVKDAFENPMTTASQTVTVTDTTQPTADGTASASFASRKIAITFSETMATSGANSIGDKANYQFSKNNGATYEALPDGTTITVASDAKSVIITLPEGNTPDVNYRVKVGYMATTGLKTVADEAGNILSAISGSQEVIISEDSAPAISTSKELVVTGEKTLRVQRDTNSGKGIFGSVDASDFEYTVDGSTWKNVASAKLVTVDNVQWIEFGLNDTLSASTTRTNVKVRTKALTEGQSYKSKSALETPIAYSITSVESLEPDDTLAAWPFRTALKSAELLNNTTLRVEFDGRVDAAGTNLMTFFKVYEGTDAKTISTSPAQDGDNAFILTLASGTTFDTTKAITVKTVTYNDISGTTNWAKDSNGVYYAENTTGVTASVTSDLKAYKVDASLTSSVLTTNDTITVDFNQAIELSSIGTDMTAVPFTIDANGKISFTGVNLGTLEGFTVDKAYGEDADTTGKASIGLTSGSETQITIKFTVGTASAGKVVANGKIKYTPSAKIKSALNKEVKVASIETNDAENAAPVIYSSTVSNDNQKVTVKFSEAMAKDTLIDGTGKLANVTVTQNSVDKTTSCTAELSADGKTLTITSTANFAANDTVAFTNDVTDATGEKITAITLTVSNVDDSLTIA